MNNSFKNESDRESSTVVGGTTTMAGFIPHLKFMGMDLPVAIRTVHVDGDSRVDGKEGRKIMTDEFRRPVPDYAGEGKYYFATPGGGRVIARMEARPMYLRAAS